ncbi:hypothetical protein GW17_00025976 [Ensete ventricosum]|nr:hypothetical protein GW17_00025976 [Ensete ventricosum]
MWALEYHPDMFSMYEEPELVIEKNETSKGKVKSIRQFGKFERENIKNGSNGSETPLPMTVFLVASVLKEKSAKLLQEARGLDDVVKAHQSLTKNGGLSKRLSCRFFAQIGKCIYHAVQHLGNPFCFTVDPFADANADDSGAGTKEYVHIRIQQRNGRKSLTTVQGLKKEFSYNKILKDLKREFCCNGTVVQDPELGQVIVLPLLFDVLKLRASL